METIDVIQGDIEMRTGACSHSPVRTCPTHPQTRA